MTTILFQERQHFKMVLLWIIIFGSDALLLYGVYLQVIKGVQFGDNPMSNTGLLIAAAVSLFVTTLLLIARLETRITENGIYVRFFPFHLRFRKYSWDNIYKCFVRKYAPIKEYGGWGLRTSFLGKGKALTTGGNQGLQLEFTNGSKLLIGTNKQAEIQKILARLHRLPQESQ